MKSHLAKVSLALLSAAFLLGCQEQGSEPVGPEGLGPGFAKVEFVKVFSDNGKKFAMNTTPQSSGTITMKFDVDTDQCVADPFDAEVEAVDRLKDQLVGLVPDADNPLFSLFNVKVDRTTTSATRGNDLQVTYDPDNGLGVILGWAHSDRAAVSENERVFLFTGGQIRVGEEDGKPSDRIRILCPSKDVTVTVTNTVTK